MFMVDNPPKCPHCGGDPLENFYAAGHGWEKYMCRACLKEYTVYDEAAYNDDSL